MSDQAVFQASFADFKIVKTRNTAQFIFEIPLEGADAALSALGGVPRPDSEIWVAIARIDPKAVSEAPKPEKEPSPFVQEISEKARRKWSELRPSQQAAMRCNEKSFWVFIGTIWKCVQIGHGESAEYVRHHCGVTSRADILEGTEAARKWADLDRQYMAWLNV
jgi:hypothetical protein